jgi:hypothetical protein
MCPLPSFRKKLFRSGFGSTRTGNPLDGWPPDEPIILALFCPICPLRLDAKVSDLYGFLPSGDVAEWLKAAVL